MDLQASRSTGEHHDQDRDYIVDTDDDKHAKKIVQAALGHQEAARAVPTSDAEMAMLVIQNSLRGVIHRAVAAAEN